MKINNTQIILNDGSISKTINALVVIPTWERYGEIIEDISGKYSEDVSGYRIKLTISIFGQDTDGNDITDWLFTSFFPSTSKTVELSGAGFDEMVAVMIDDKVQTQYPKGSSQLGKYTFTLAKTTLGDLPDTP